MKKGCLIGIGAAVLIAVIAFFMFKNYYNNFVTLEEGVNEKWSQVENVYQRRADLIPNLVEVVKGYAGHEKETLMGVTEARAKVGGQVNIGPDVLNNPQALAKFQQAQGALSGALSRLLVTVERYPDLKANQNFLQLQGAWNEVEEQISASRRAFNASVTIFNNGVETFPSNIMAGIMNYKRKALFEIPDEERQNVNAKDLFNK